MTAERTDRTYRFDPADTSGVFLGLGVIQCALLGGGLLAGVGVLTAGLPLLLAAVPVVGGGVASFARVGGHPVWEWLPLGIGWLVANVTGRRRWFARLPLLTIEGTDEAAPMPPCLHGLELIEVPWRGRLSMGVVYDSERHTLTAAVRVHGPQFVVEPRADQEQLLAGWGDVLNQFAVEGGAVTHTCPGPTSHAPPGSTSIGHGCPRAMRASSETGTTNCWATPSLRHPATRRS